MGNRVLEIITKVIILSKISGLFSPCDKRKSTNISKVIIPLLAVLFKEKLLKLSNAEASQLSAGLCTVVDKIEEDPFTNEKLEALVSKFI